MSSPVRKRPVFVFPPVRPSLPLGPGPRQARCRPAGKSRRATVELWATFTGDRGLGGPVPADSLLVFPAVPARSPQRQAPETLTGQGSGQATERSDPLPHSWQTQQGPPAPAYRWGRRASEGKVVRGVSGKEVRASGSQFSEQLLVRLPTTTTNYPNRGRSRSPVNKREANCPRNLSRDGWCD